jgi:hypothetical protein
MINKSKIVRTLSLSTALAGFVLISGAFFSADAQTSRDPFAKPGWARTREAPKGGTRTAGSQGDQGPANVGAPPIEQRIAYYKQMRESAAVNGEPMPKVTSVLTLSEMAVTGIFKTSRGYAAMVEATPIRLSYTIYPGERFFDGQLVAVEENRLVFRKVTKMSNGKFVASVENMPLRKYTAQQEIQGTAPVGTESAAAPRPVSSEAMVASGPIVSPLDEMSAQKDDDKGSDAKGKRPARVAKSDQ